MQGWSLLHEIQIFRQRETVWASNKESTKLELFPAKSVQPREKLVLNCPTKHLGCLSKTPITYWVLTVGRNCSNRDGATSIDDNVSSRHWPFFVGFHLVLVVFIKFGSGGFSNLIWFPIDLHRLIDQMQMHFLTSWGVFILKSVISDSFPG